MLLLSLILSIVIGVKSTGKTLFGKVTSKIFIILSVIINALAIILPIVGIAVGINNEDIKKIGILVIIGGILDIVNAAIATIVAKNSKK